MKYTWCELIRRGRGCSSRSRNSLLQADTARLSRYQRTVSSICDASRSIRSLSSRCKNANRLTRSARVARCSACSRCRATLVECRCCGVEERACRDHRHLQVSGYCREMMNKRIQKLYYVISSSKHYKSFS